MSTSINIGLGIGDRTAGDFATGPAAPLNTSAPVVSGTVYAAQTLSTTNGTWIDADTFEYQWHSNLAAIPGATSQTFVVTTAQEGTSISCTVTATGPGGTRRGCLDYRSTPRSV